MKQIIQDLKTGETALVEVPAPEIQPGHVLIRTCYTLVSRGTERMLVDFGRAGWIDKARQQPEKVKQVLQKIKTDGLTHTVNIVMRKLNQPIPLGYCHSGEVIAVGAGVTHVKPGDLVASNGPHAGVVLVPRNLVSPIPEGVSAEKGTFTVIGAIALQGIRLIKPELGETVVVTGLGLIGLMAIQLLKASGCRVIGIEPDRGKRDIAQSLGIETLDPTQQDPVAGIHQATGHGADAVLITASSKSQDIIAQAAQMSRKRGRIVLTGVIGLNLNRADFYEKELSFQVSCSYGPGRYDPEYEEKGRDYPLPYVRWTEQRNFEAVLESIRSGQVVVDPLISEVKPIEEFGSIYASLGDSSKCASLLHFSETDTREIRKVIIAPSPSRTSGEGIAIIGAGNYTSSMILPTLARLKADIRYIASARGLSALQLAKKYNISHAASSVEQVLSDEGVGRVMITTRHNTHANLVGRALAAGKEVFVEKPLYIHGSDEGPLIDLWRKSGRNLTVGFNRRFSPHALQAKALINPSDAAINVVATMNAGSIPNTHWTQDMEIGGGRIVGEACHLIDLLVYLTGSRVTSVVMSALGTHRDRTTDNATLLLQFENGSNGTVHYFSNGHKGYSKERVELFYAGKTAIIDNYRTSTYYGLPKSSLKTKQDKGQREMFRRWLREGPTGEGIIPPEEIINVSRASIAALESLESGHWVDIL